MYLTVRNQLKNLSVREYKTLRTLCRLSKNLFNEAMYSVRQYYFAEHKYLRYENNYHVCKGSENYQALGTEIAQLNIPPNIADKEIQQVRIHPRDNARFFEIEYVYEQPEQKADVDSDKFLVIDLGLDNLATCVTSEGASFIVDGKQIKSYNRLYNKENARLQSIKDKQEIKGLTERQYRNLRKRNARINHATSVVSRRIITYCINHRTGNIVVGYNPEWKREISIGSANTQNFVQIPHGQLREKLAYLCELYGINYVEQEESYTSKASFFDNDNLPTYNADNPQKYHFSGTRITRGQYRTSTGYILNADVNGALNILRKSKMVNLRVLQDRGCVNQPRRIRVFWSGSMRVQTLGRVPNFTESPRL